jgi:undecaprenyl-diphosphatase
MDFLSAFLLGLIQGLTEFLPISSSGHLVLGQHLLGWQTPEIFFNVCLHLGTFLAVLIVFHQDIGNLFKGGLCFGLKGNVFRGRRPDLREKIFLLVTLGTIPTIVLGFFAHHELKGLFASLPLVSINLLITGTFLWLTRYANFSKPRDALQSRWQDAFLVGIAQGLALAPGISRSGSTISAGLFLGWEREWAGRFSFLLFVPAIMGALSLELLQVEIQNIEMGPVFLGTVTAAVTGYVALKFLLKMLRKGSFYVFAPYCWALGTICLIWSWLGK